MKLLDKIVVIRRKRKKIKNPYKNKKESYRRSNRNK